jgi:TRAP transporter TAXI family solute receptor
MTLTRRGLLFGGLATLLTGCSYAGYEGPERTVTIAAGESGGFYLAFAELLAAELNQAERRLHCRAIATEASVANVHLVHSGGADLGLALADVAQAAVVGTDSFPEPVPLRSLGRVYENYLQLVIRADGQIWALSDLAGRAMSLGAVGSGAALLGERLLAKAGLRVDARHLLVADAIAALRDRRISALLWSGGIPTPALAELNTVTPIRLLPLDAALPALRAAYGSVYEQVQVPADAYRGSGELPTIGVANLLVCAPTLPDDIAAAVVRVLVNQAADLVPGQAIGTQFLDVRTLIGTDPVPLHLGAADAYRCLHG